MKPEGKNWLFAIMILGDIIQTSVLEWIAALSPPECVVSPLAAPANASANGTCRDVAMNTVITFSVIGFFLAIVPMFVKGFMMRVVRVMMRSVMMLLRTSVSSVLMR